MISWRDISAAGIRRDFSDFRSRRNSDFRLCEWEFVSCRQGSNNRQNQRNDEASPAALEDSHIVFFHIRLASRFSALPFTLHFGHS